MKSEEGVRQSMSYSGILSGTAVGGIQKSVEKLRDAIALESKQKAILTEKTRKEFKLIENSTEIEVNTEKRNLRESEMKLTKMVDEKFYSIRLDLAKEKKLRETSTEEFFEDIETKMTEIRTDIDSLTNESTYILPTSKFLILSFNIKLQTEV